MKEMPPAGKPANGFTEGPLQREPVVTIFERSVEGRRAAQLPELDVPARPLDELIPKGMLRAEGPRFPEVSEPEIVRHYNRISRRNFDLDTGFYPLGSCTMKHNPKLNERVAALAGNSRLHPLTPPERAQGCGCCREPSRRSAAFRT
jgi:glycine dehydrogenase subunit 2